MFRSIKAQFILAIITAVLFMMNMLLNIQFSRGDQFTQYLFFFLMILATYNAGMLTQKYISSRKKDR